MKEMISSWRWQRGSVDSGGVSQRTGRGQVNKGVIQASRAGVWRKNADGSYFRQQEGPLLFSRTQRVGGFLNLRCFPRAQGSGQVKHYHYLPQLLEPL